MQHNNHPILIPGIEAQALCLQTQHRLFSRAIGTLIPSSVSPAEIETALDLICGPGAWVIDLAKTYSHLHVIGLDMPTSFPPSDAKTNNHRDVPLVRMADFAPAMYHAGGGGALPG